MMKKIFIFLISFFSFCNFCFATSKAPVDITTMSITELQDALDKGYLTSELLVNLYLDRINEYDSMFNSINQINENAINDAIKLDEERASGNVRGPLHGIPILVKNNIDVYGLATTAGTKSLSNNMPIENADVIQKLIDAGAIILGTTNMSELAFSSKNSYSSYGYVRNVFNTEYTSYGSSGGSAVSLGAAFAAASLGTDTNSSVRIPASAAGLVGYRPTLGLISRDGVIPYDIERDTVGILTKNVSDNALILSVISGEDSDDSYTSGFDAYNYNDFDNSFDLSNVTIGVVTEYLKGVSSSGSGGTQYTDTEIYNLLDDSIKKMIDAGANVIYVDDFYLYKNYSIATSTYAGITMCDNFNEYIKGTTGTIRSFQQLASSSGHVQRLSGYAKGCGGKYKSKSTRDSKKESFRTYVDNYYNKYNLDVIAYPTIKSKPFKYNSNGSDNPGSFLSSVIGYPSITVPVGKDSSGFSYGLEFMALKNNDSLLLNIASGFETIVDNDISVSNLTPALYSIPEEVVNLKYIYENGDLSDDLHNKIYNYFINYNENEDYIAEAQSLIDIYNEEINNSSGNVIEIKKSNNFIYYCCMIIILLILIVSYFLVRKKHS